MRFAKNVFGFFLSLAILSVLICGCAPAQAPQPADTNSAYPIGNAEQTNPSSAYPSGSGYRSPALPADENIVPPADAPQPEPGKASVSGVIYSNSSSTALPGFQFYFTPAQGENNDEVPPVLTGAFSEKGDILVNTGSKGEFQVNNIPPGNYYIILLAPGDYLVAVNSKTDEKPRMVTLNADEAKPLGLIVFP